MHVQMAIVHFGQHQRGAYRRLCVHGLVVVLAVALAARRAAWAGPLTPPAGTITETPGPEPRTPVSPSTTPGDGQSVFIISQSGSYYLTGNVVATGSRNGIVIAADHVTLDLNGFAVSQAADGTGFPTGVRALSPVRNALVKNGTVRAFRGYGFFGNFNGSAFHDLAVVDCLSGQLEIGASTNVTVRNVRTRGASGEVGIQVGAGSLVESCTTDGGTIGITVGTGSTVRSCTVVSPISVGVFAPSSLVVDCTIAGPSSASSASNGGVSTSGSTRVERCVIRGGVAAGVYAGGFTDVVECTISQCPTGVAAVGRTSIIGCTISQSTTTGIALRSAGSVVMGNRLTSNAAAITVTSSASGPNGGNVVGEVVDLSGGGTAPASGAGLNIVY